MFHFHWILTSQQFSKANEYYLNNKLTIVKCNCENVEIYLGADRTVCMQVFVTADWIIFFSIVILTNIF